MKVLQSPLIGVALLLSTGRRMPRLLLCRLTDLKRRRPDPFYLSTGVGMRQYMINNGGFRVQKS